ncbi:MAG: FAD-dependent oxidoreductase, partial [Acidobacteriota bacterium]
MPRTVLVIGGGAAGLAAAVRLAKRYTVTLLEARSDLGGRLIVGHEQNGPGVSSKVGTNSPGGLGSDSLPTVILGHHRETQTLVESLGTAHLIQFPNRLVFGFLLPGGRTVTLHRPWLPGPLRTLVSTILFRALPFPDRWRALNVMEQV